MSTLLTEALKTINIETKSIVTTGDVTNVDYQTLSSSYDDEPLLGVAKNSDVARGDIDYDYSENLYGFQPNATTRDKVLACTYQIKHSILRTTVELHAHCLHEDTANETGTIVWQARYRIRRNGAVADAWSACTTGTRVLDSALDNGLDVYDFFDEIDISGTNISDMIDVQLRRDYDGGVNGTDDYTGTAYLSQWDFHVQRKNLTGSKYKWSE